MGLTLKELELEIMETISKGKEIKGRDEFAGFMTEKDKQFVLKLQQNQMTGSDYYYDNYQKQKATFKFNFDFIKTKEKIPVTIPEGTLGKIPKFSINNPKVVLEIPKMKFNTNDSLLKETIESIYEALYEGNDVFPLFPWKQTIEFLSLSKGKKLFSKIFPLFSYKQKMRVIRQILDNFDQLDILEYESKELDLFMSAVLPHIVCLEVAEPLIYELLSLFVEKLTLWIFLNKVGIIILSWLLSQVKKELSDNNNLFIILQGNLHLAYEMEDADYLGYFWQFVTLLTFNCSLDQKKKIIIELREFILLSLKNEDQNAEQFLSVLGINPSQIK